MRALGARHWVRDSGTQWTHWELAFEVKGQGERSEKRQELHKGMGLSEGVEGLHSGLMLGRAILGWLGLGPDHSPPTPPPPPTRWWYMRTQIFRA